MSSQSYGFIETRGLIGAIEAADAMAKAANVRMVRRRGIGAGLVTVVCEGDLASCQAAVEAGRNAAVRVGELVSAHVIPRPDRDTEGLVMVMLGHEPGPLLPSSAGHSETGSAPDGERKSDPSVTSDSETEILNLLSRHAGGMACDEICQALGMGRAGVLTSIKKLMDGGLVEKVHRKYYARSGRHQ
jgi:microcompartment protein CcmL/EutN/biotin operon repressor